MDQFEKALEHLLAGFPTSYASDQMRTLWLDTWSQHPVSVISRTVDSVRRTAVKFPSLDEFMGLAEEEATKQQRIGRRDRMDKCECHSGFVETKPDTFRPCEKCLPETYARWSSGEYELRS